MKLLMRFDLEGMALKYRADRSKLMTDKELLLEAKSVFSKRKYISIPLLQRSLQLPFRRALMCLEKLVDEGFAVPVDKEVKWGAAMVKRNFLEIKELC